MYIPLFVHSHYSVLQGLAKPKDIIAAAQERGMQAIALIDINNMSGAIEFYKTAKDKKIKPIIGTCITTNEGELVLIALNKAGYHELLQLVNVLNSKTCLINDKISITLDQLKELSLNNIICLTGHEGSTLYNKIIQDFKFRDNWEENTDIHLVYLSNIFKDRLYIELQYSECDKLSEQIKTEYIKLAFDFQIKLIACPRAYYINLYDQELHKILISTKENKSLKDLENINGENYKFFAGYNWYLPTNEEFCSIIKHDRAIENTNIIADMVEDYNLSLPASLPDFKCPKKLTAEEYFKQLCNEGWKTKILGRIPKDQLQKYKDRIEEEIAVFKEANLFNYFLIVKDIIDYAISKNSLVGTGRGSIGGCLTGYLLGIHQIDSIKYNLIFSRFYNAGRKGSLPDIDTDFEPNSRDDIIKFIIKKYGKENAMQIATYSTLMGRHALKAVFKAYNDVGFAEQNEITKHIVDKAKISDQLQDMKDSGEEPSVIRWCLINKSEQFSNWCNIGVDGQLQGPLADRFEKAIKLEGINSATSVHAAGIVIAPKPLRELVPIVLSKDKSQIIGCSMNDLDFVGVCKIDCLSLSTLSRLKDV